jgi:hypothetical protein
MAISKRSASPSNFWTVRIIGADRSGEFEVGGLDFDGDALSDEIEAQLDVSDAGSVFYEAFEAAQWAGGDFDACADRNFRGENDFQAGFKAEKDVAELVLERLLIGNVEEIGDVIALENFLALWRFELEENVIWEERFFEDGGFAFVFPDAAIERERDFEALTLAIFGQFFLATRPGVSHVPEQISHRRDIIGKTIAGASVKRKRS